MKTQQANNALPTARGLTHRSEQPSLVPAERPLESQRGPAHSNRSSSPWRGTRSPNCTALGLRQPAISEERNTQAVFNT